MLISEASNDTPLVSNIDNNKNNSNDQVSKLSR
jgi:hypothetical protein